ncbi:unnamed protein product, partial [marine sediment metagenome]
MASFFEKGFGGIFGGGENKQNPSFVDPAQAPFLDWLRTQGQDIAQGQMGAGGQGDFANQLGGQLMGQGQQFLGGLQNAGNQLNQFMGPGFMQQQIGALGQATQQNFGDLLGQIGGGASMSGGFGGTRQGVAEGVGLSRANTSFQQGVGNIMQQDLGRRQNAALGQAGIQNQANMGGIQGANSLFNLGMAPFQSQFAPLTNFANLVGQPTVLGGGGVDFQTPGILGGFGNL